MNTQSKQTEKEIKAETKKVIAENKKEISDADLMKDLNDFNLESLIQKSAKGRSIWKKEFKNKFSDNEKTARRRIRKEQENLSKGLLHSLLTKQSIEVSKSKAEELYAFYKEGLEDFAIYSNISEKESKSKFDLLKTSYEKMKLLIS